MLGVTWHADPDAQDHIEVLRVTCVKPNGKNRGKTRKKQKLAEIAALSTNLENYLQEKEVPVTLTENQAVVGKHAYDYVHTQPLFPSLVADNPDLANCNLSLWQQSDLPVLCGDTVTSVQDLMSGAAKSNVFPLPLPAPFNIQLLSCNLLWTLSRDDTPTDLSIADLAAMLAVWPHQAMVRSMLRRRGVTRASLLASDQESGYAWYDLSSLSIEHVFFGSGALSWRSMWRKDIAQLAKQDPSIAPGWTNCLSEEHKYFRELDAQALEMYGEYSMTRGDEEDDENNEDPDPSRPHDDDETSRDRKRRKRNDNDEDDDDDDEDEQNDDEDDDPDEVEAEQERLMIEGSDNSEDWEMADELIDI